MLPPRGRRQRLIVKLRPEHAANEACFGLRFNARLIVGSRLAQRIDKQRCDACEENDPDLDSLIKSCVRVPESRYQRSDQ